MAELHEAVADGVEGGGPVELLPDLKLAGLDGDAVIAHREAAADDVHIGAGLRIQRVGVGAVFRGGNQQIVEIEVLGEIGVQLPGGCVAGMDAVHGHVFAAVQEQQSRSPRREGVEARPEVRILGVPVHRTGTDDGDVLGVLGGEQGLIHGDGVALPGGKVYLFPSYCVDGAGDDGIVLPLRPAEECCPLAKFQGDAALEELGLCQVRARREEQAPVFGQAADGAADSLGVIVNTVADSAEGMHVDAAGLGPGPKFTFGFKRLAAYREPVFRVRFEAIEGEDVAVAFILLLTVEEYRKLLRRIVGRAVFKLKAGAGDTGEEKFHIHDKSLPFRILLRILKNLPQGAFHGDKQEVKRRVDDAEEDRAHANRETAAAGCGRKGDV